MAATAQTPLILGDGALTLEQLDALYDRPLHIQISDSAWQRVERGRQLVEQAIDSGKTLYGINTGFGHLKNYRIPPGELETLQVNLVRSHAVGVGPPVPAAVVRWIMLFKLHSLLAGNSGVHRRTAELLLNMINADVLPVIPSKGSLGASGDLAPLAHLALPLIGEGQVTTQPSAEADSCASRDDTRATRPASVALQQLDLEPITLAAKEGLALVNGTQFMSALAASAVIRARRLARHADVIGAMSLEACRGSLAPFDQRVHALRPFRGARQVAQNMCSLLADSPIMESHKDCDKVQDPYSLRCMAAVHGASRDAIEHVAGIVQTEINSVTDNPILFDNGDVISGGNFHGQPLALGTDYLALALAELASISERRTFLLLCGHDGLPAMLAEDPGLNSGLMILQYTAAALVNENKTLCHPSSVDTIPTSMGQEDHVSMGATSANKLQQVVDNAETVLAIEMLCAAQGLDFRAPLKAGKGAQLAHDEFSKVIPHAERDRAFAVDVERAVEVLRSGSIIETVERHAGSLA